MKFTLSWLRTHLDTDASLDVITRTLSAIGLEVESVTNPADRIRGFRTARIAEAVQHPNADRLRVCTVETGAEAPVQVVCGAPNARTGLHVIFAAPGTYIPGSDITIKAGEIRGVTSAGMLCSLRELGLGEEHDGIAELPEGTPVGADYAAFAHLDDPLIEIAVTPDRGDALSVRGIARDLAAAGLGRLKPWMHDTVEGRFDSPIEWANDYAEAAPWVLGRTIRGVRNGPSPKWLADRLISVGLRPISALVDVTNFFTLDLGRPLHVFDADRIAGGVLTLRPARTGESLAALNGQSYTLDAADCVIADASGVQSLAGVMGGSASGASEATSSVFIECALFDPIIVARTGRRHQIHSDARARFERGIDPALLPSALEAATAMIIDLCGGEASEVVSAGEMPAWQREATLRFRRLAELGGLAVDPDRAVARLEDLGFEVAAREEDSVRVHVPSWRNDVAIPLTLEQDPTLDAPIAQRAAASVPAIEAECDLIEEVLRLGGLDAIPPVSLAPDSPIPARAFTPKQTRTAIARRALASAGLVETVGFSFLARDIAARFGATPDSLRLLNPIATDLDQMRPTPLATLTGVAQRNAARGISPVAIFEIGGGFSEDGEQAIAAGLRWGMTPRGFGQPSRAPSWSEAKADLYGLLAALGVPIDALSITTDAPGHYHPGQSGVVRQGPKTVLGRFGALHPAVLAASGIEGAAVGFELFLDAIAEPKRRRKAAPELSSFQPLTRDFAFVVARDVPADAVLRAARGAERNLITAVRLFDVYEGSHVAEGHKSLAIEVTLQPKDRSLTDTEIEAASAKIVAAVAKATGAVLR